MRTQLWTISLVSLFSLTVGCASDPTPPPETPATSDAPATSGPAEKPGDDPRQSQVNISDRIKTACGLSESEAHFGYNSAQIRQTDKDLMKKLADCFTTGPLKGEKMHLVGHADPRGENEYNMALGERRAGNVGKALLGAGLPEAQLTTSSRGELDATGTDEASWQKDRRVEITVAE